MMRNGYVMKEDAGRGCRRVVASPRPLDVVEKESVRAMVQAGQLVIAVGGGGIPVVRQGNHLKGASAVIDKDLASAKLAEMIDADLLIILTAVETRGAALRHAAAALAGSPERGRGPPLHCAKATSPRVRCCRRCRRRSSSPRPGPAAATLITLLTKARDGIEGRTGTRIG